MWTQAPKISDNAYMNQPATSEIIKALCGRRSIALNSEGEVNHNELARQVHLSQPTVTRILNGSTLIPSPRNMQKLALFLKVSPAQLRGEAAIPGLFASGLYHYPYEMDAAAS